MTDHECQHQVQVILDQSGAGFLMVRPEHVRLLDGNSTAALILAFVLNKLRMKVSNKRELKALQTNEMFFRCPANEIQRVLGFTKHRRMGGITKLTEAGLITTERREGNFLWIRVETEQLTNSLLAQKSGKRLSGKPKTGSPESGLQKSGKRPSEGRKAEIPICKKELKEKRKEKTLSAAERPTGRELPSTPSLNGHPQHQESQDSRIPFGKPPSPIMEMVDEFIAGLEKNRMLPLSTPPKRGQWSREFQKLIEEVQLRDHVSETIALKYVRCILRDHISHLKETYQPRCYCARTFRDRFLRVVDAYERRNNSGKAQSNGHLSAEEVL